MHQMANLPPYFWVPSMKIALTLLFTLWMDCESCRCRCMPYPMMMCSLFSNYNFSVVDLWSNGTDSQGFYSGKQWIAMGGRWMLESKKRRCHAGNNWDLFVEEEIIRLKGGQLWHRYLLEMFSDFLSWKDYNLVWLMDRRIFEFYL